MGYLLKYEEGGAKVVLEADTISCSHCQKVVCKQDVMVNGVKIPGWADRGAWCFCCGKPLCLRCYGALAKTGCIPFMKSVELNLRRNRLFREV